MRHVLIVLALAIPLGVAGAEEREHHGPPPPNDPRFEFLKKLEGTWKGDTGKEGKPEGVFEFRVTAGGHAVEERDFVGSPMEMLTVYHMDGEDLVATHYCMVGNQPRVKAAKKIRDDTLAFSCSGRPGNAGSHDDGHIHGWSMRLDREGRLHYSGEFLEKGEVTEKPSFVMTKQRKTASR